MKNRISLQNIGYSKLLFAACFFVYAASYTGRVNYSAALAAIVSEGLFTKGQAGIIGSVFFFCYGICQIFWGFLGDRISPFKMIITGTFFAAFSNMLFPLCTSYVSMALVWGFNGISHSMLWSPILRIFSNVISKELRAKACLNISASLPVGTIITYLAASLIIKYIGWKSVFTAASVMLFAALIFFVFTVIKIRPALIYSAPEYEKVSEQAMPRGAGTKLFTVFVTSGLLIAVLPTALHGMLKEGITTWVPTMVTETYGTSASFSVFLTIFLPVFNVAGVYLISPVYNRLMKKNELTTAALCMCFAVIPLTALLFLSKLPPVVSVMLLAVVTTSMHAFNYLLITLVPVKFARYGKTASVTGILNASAYAGCALSTYGFGMIAEKLGWHQTVYVWLGIVFLTGILCLVSNKKWKRFCFSMEEKDECLRL